MNTSTPATAPRPMKSQGVHHAVTARLAQFGVPYEVEIRLPAASRRMRSGHFIADIGVFRDGRLVALCEAKNRARALRGRQRENYDGSGLPYIVAGHDNIEEAARWLATAAGVLPTPTH